MTTRQLDKQYEAFIVELTSNGSVVRDVIVWAGVKNAKATCVRMVSDALEAHYGRGDHVGRVYGAVWSETYSDLEVSYGLSRPDWLKAEVVFSL